MHIKNLPSPGLYSNGIKLRVEAAKAISAAEIAGSKSPGGRTSTATNLRRFFIACGAALDTVADVTAPTVATRVRTSATRATITFSEPLDQKVVPALASVAIGARVLSAVTVNSAGQLVVTGVAITAGDTITYTQPAQNALRDPAGNLVANFTGALA
jgi:hypothetical protein